MLVTLKFGFYLEKHTPIRFDCDEYASKKFN
jgi:hypothetical protein